MSSSGARMEHNHIALNEPVTILNHVPVPACVVAYIGPAHASMHVYGRYGARHDQPAYGPALLTVPDQRGRGTGAGSSVARGWPEDRAWQQSPSCWPSGDR